MVQVRLSMMATRKLDEKPVKTRCLSKRWFAQRLPKLSLDKYSIAAGHHIHAQSWKKRGLSLTINNTSTWLSREDWIDLLPHHSFPAVTPQWQDGAGPLHSMRYSYSYRYRVHVQPQGCAPVSRSDDQLGIRCCPHREALITLPLKIF